MFCWWRCNTEHSREKCICACFGAYLCMPRAWKVHVKCLQSACKCACNSAYPRKIFIFHHNSHAFSIWIIFLHIKEYFKIYIYYFGNYLTRQKYSRIYLNCCACTQQHILIFIHASWTIKPHKNQIEYKSIFYTIFIFYYNFIMSCGC